MRRKEERLRRGIDRIALQQLMETFRPSKISFIKRIKGVEVLEVTSSQMRETDTTDRISHLLAKLKIYIRSQLIRIELLVKQVL
jgi:predicted regulator of amino acid metabolism with ACT domain